MAIPTFHMDQRRGAPWQGPISMARVAGQVSPLREERATVRRPEADLLSVDGLGAGVPKPLAGPRNG